MTQADVPEFSIRLRQMCAGYESWWDEATPGAYYPALEGFPADVVWEALRKCSGAFRKRPVPMQVAEVAKLIADDRVRAAQPRPVHRHLPEHVPTAADVAVGDAFKSAYERLKAERPQDTDGRLLWLAVGEAMGADPAKPVRPPRKTREECLARIAAEAAARDANGTSPGMSHGTSAGRPVQGAAPERNADVTRYTSVTSRDVACVAGDVDDEWPPDGFDGPEGWRWEP